MKRCKLGSGVSAGASVFAFGGALLAGLVGPGCATKPSPTTQESVAQALPNAVIPQQWGMAAEASAVPEGWLKTFGDPALEAVVGEALKYNLTLAAAQGRLEQAAGQARLSGASLKPVLDASGKAMGQQAFSGRNFDSRGAGLTLSWELDVWGRMRSEAAAGRFNYEGATYDFEFARQSVAAQAAKAYFLAIETRLQRDIAADDVTTAAELVRVTELRRGAGKVKEEDLQLARSELAATRERLRAAETAHGQARRAIETLMGRYPAAQVETAAGLPAMPPTPPAGVPSEVLERRPDLVAAERRVKAAFQNVRAAKLARLPRIGLTGSVGGRSSQLGSLVSNGGFFSVGANFFAPILDGGRTAAGVEISTGQQKTVLADYGQVALKAFTEVEQSLENETTLAEREALLAEAVATSGEALRLRQLEADAGKADVLSVLQLRSRNNTAKAGLIAVQTARRSERVNLHLALGGDFEARP